MADDTGTMTASETIEKPKRPNVPPPLPVAKPKPTQPLPVPTTSNNGDKIHNAINNEDNFDFQKGNKINFCEISIIVITVSMIIVCFVCMCLGSGSLMGWFCNIFYTGDVNTVRGECGWQSCNKYKDYTYQDMKNLDLANAGGYLFASNLIVILLHLVLLALCYFRYIKKPSITKGFIINNNATIEQYMFVLFVGIMSVVFLLSSEIGFIDTFDEYFENEYFGELIIDSQFDDVNEYSCDSEGDAIIWIIFFQMLFCGYIIFSSLHFKN